jgi:translation initiation factor 1
MADGFNNPFAKLPGAKATPPAAPKAPARAVVRYERKGHGGKEMTRVEKLELSPKDLEKWLKDAKSGLGCGGIVEGGALLLQGDQRERLRAWLEKRGVAKITIS